MPTPHSGEALPRLQLKNISKSFSGFKANDQVSLDLRAGEIHALLGENGAGKSTLVKILYGVQPPDSGEIWLEGKRMDMRSPKQARRAGIGMIFQHFSLFEGMSVLENIALGLDEALDMSALKRRIEEVLKSYSLPLDPDRMVHTLSVGEKQRIEIVRCLLQKPKIIIMDEPTSVLTPQEVDALFTLLQHLKSEGCSILYISHKLPEIQALCDRATVLRHGKKVGEIDPKTASTNEMAALMIGADVMPIAAKKNHTIGAVRLKVENLSLPAQSQFDVPLTNISFEARAGELLCIAGVAGNGQSELLLALAGEVSVSPQSLMLEGQAIGAMNASERRKYGLLSVPEERNGHAAVPEMSLYENTLLTARDRMGIVSSHGLTAGFISWRKARDFAQHVIAQFDVRTRGVESLAGSLSGGNLQKFIMGREILQKPDVLIVAQPTWGVDAGAATAIRQKLIDLLDEGVAIVVISQDLDELLEIGDSIAVLHMGLLSKPRPISEMSKAEIGLLMGGQMGAGLGHSNDKNNNQEAMHV